MVPLLQLDMLACNPGRALYWLCWWRCVLIYVSQVNHFLHCQLANIWPPWIEWCTLCQSVYPCWLWLPLADVDKLAFSCLQGDWTDVFCWGGRIALGDVCSETLRAGTVQSSLPFWESSGGPRDFWLREDDVASLCLSFGISVEAAQVFWLACVAVKVAL